MNTIQLHLNNCSMISDVITNNHTDSNSPVFLLLHGYSHSADVIYSKLHHVLPKDSLILAPNGPFPVPIEKKNNDKHSRWFDPNWRLGFAWYFFNFHQDQYFIPTSVPTDYLINVLNSLNINSSRELHIIGFSQGGYLAGACSEKLKESFNLKSITGIACRFRKKNMSLVKDVKVNLILGKKDTIIDFENSYKDYKDFRFNGEFISLENTGHVIDQAVCESIKSLLV